MPSQRSTAAILLEALIVVAGAAVFALVANQLSPRGLNLTLDYFPRTSTPTNQPLKVLPPAPPPPAPAAAATTNDNPEAAETDQRIKEKGLQPISRAQTEQLFHDPRYLQGLVVFIDARGDSYYAESHIPGAYQLDNYHREKYLAADLTPCLNADAVVVYCTGGECEDAESTAITLREAGVSSQRLFIYGGGFNDWSAHHLPLEKGERNSGLPPEESK